MAHRLVDICLVASVASPTTGWKKITEKIEPILRQKGDFLQGVTRDFPFYHHDDVAGLRRQFQADSAALPAFDPDDITIIEQGQFYGGNFGSLEPSARQDQCWWSSTLSDFACVPPGKLCVQIL